MIPSSALSEQNSDAQASSPPLTRFVRLVLTVTLGLASFGLCWVQVLFGPERIGLLLSNQWPVKQRLVALAALWGGALCLALGLFWWARRGPTPVERQRGVVRLAAPLSISAFVPICFVQQAWEGRELAYLVYLFVLGLCLERLLHPALGVIRRRLRRTRLWTHLRPLASGRVAAALGLAIALGLGCYYLMRIGQLANVSHFKFQTSSSDLAEYDNLFYNALRGHPFRAPAVAVRMADWSHLAGHAEWVLYLLLPFYAIAPGAPALLWIQAGLVGLSVIPVYLLATARLGKAVALAFAVAFLAMPVTQQPNFYDFHFTPAAMFFVSWLLYFLYRLDQRPSRALHVAVLVCLLCALSCREDIGIGTAVLGLFLVLRGRLVRQGVLITVISGAFFLTMKFAIMPLFGTWWFDDMYGDLKSEGVAGFGSIIVTLLSNQAFVLRAILNEPKALYLLHMTVPLLALWLRKPLLVLAVLPAMISSLWVTNRPPLFQPSFQYTYLWLPYVVGASILAVDRRRSAATAIALLVVALSLDVQKGVLLGNDQITGGFSRKDLVVRPDDQTRMEQFEKITALLPKTASVSVTEREGPHLSARLNMFSLKFALGADPEYLLVGQPGIRGEEVHVRQALESGNYGVIATEGPFTLVQRGASTKKNGPLLRRVHGRVKRRH